jgi:hypothetical protein
MRAENPADFLRILRDAAPAATQERFLRCYREPDQSLFRLVEAKHISSEETISRFRRYFLEHTGSDDLYQHLVAEAERRREKEERVLAQLWEPW